MTNRTYELSIEVRTADGEKGTEEKTPTIESKSWGRVYQDSERGIWALDMCYGYPPDMRATWHRVFIDTDKDVVVAKAVEMQLRGMLEEVEWPT